MALHVLQLSVGGQRYALPSRCVVEVVPAVPLRSVPGAARGLAGLLAYRGRIVPVVDLGEAFGGQAAAARLSTRIAVCDPEGASRPVGAYAGAAAAGAALRLVGVRAEGMLDAGFLDPEAPGSSPGPATPGLGGAGPLAPSPALGRLTRDAGGLVQLVEVRDLIGPALWDALEREAPTAVPGSPVAGGGGAA